MGTLGSWIIGLLLVGIIALIIYQIRKDKRNGKSSCGNSCGGCPNASLCHTKKQK